MAENVNIDPNPSGRRLGVYKQAAARCGLPYKEWHRRQLAGEKRCFRCKVWKPKNQFSKDSSRGNGIASSCKPCTSEAATASRYNMTRRELSKFKDTHGHKCGICGAAETLYVDHCHETGKLRGLLCPGCNTAIGQFREDPRLFFSALKYLGKLNG